MQNKPAYYKHDLGGGLFLDAYSIDPKVSDAKLKEFVVSKETGGIDIGKFAENIRMIEHPEGNRLWTLDELKFEAVEGKYEIPKEFKAYREAVSIREDIKGNFNGPLGIIKGTPGTNMVFIEGGFYDWKGTQLAEDKDGTMVPAKPIDLYEEIMEIPVEKLVGEGRFIHARGQEERFHPRYDGRLLDRMTAGTLENYLKNKGCSNEVINRLKGKRIEEVLGDGAFSRVFDIEYNQIKALENYPVKTTLEKIMFDAGLTDNDRARYLGFAHFMFPENGNKLLLVHRAKGLGIAPDCISSVGSTPVFNKEFLNEGFNFQSYYRDHITQEMGEEFNLKKEEVDVGGFYFSHMVKTGILNPAFGTTTPLTTEEIAERAFGDEEALSEHSVIYETTIPGLSKVLKRFPVFGDISVILNRMCNDRMNE